MKLSRGAVKIQRLLQTYQASCSLCFSDARSLAFSCSHILSPILSLLSSMNAVGRQEVRKVGRSVRMPDWLSGRGRTVSASRRAGSPTLTWQSASWDFYFWTKCRGLWCVSRLEGVGLRVTLGERLILCSCSLLHKEPHFVEGGLLTCCS